MTRQRVAFLGLVTDVAVGIAAGGHDVIAVLGHGGRPGLARLRRALQKTPAERVARALGARFINVSGRGLRGVVDEVAAARVDVLVCAAWPGRVPERLLAVSRLGGVNVHPSLLPRHRGPDPIAWTILSGDVESGVTFHRMVHELDAGDILAQHHVPVYADDTRGTLGERCFTVAVREVGACLAALGPGAVGVPQGPGRSEGRPGSDVLAFDAAGLDAPTLARRLRARLPGARVQIGDVDVEVLRAVALTERTATPGRVAATYGAHIVVAAREGSIWLTAKALRGVRAGDRVRL
jgi:methionyl-tRNA formyltransferase